MKRFLLSFILLTSLTLINGLNAQVYIQNFSDGLANDWVVNSNTSISNYSRPGLCNIVDKGLLTPGVGPSAPTGFVLPKISLNQSVNDVILKFGVFVFDANLKCATAKNFPCPTFVKAYIVPTSWNDPLGTPAVGQYYAALPNYQVVYANTENTIVFNNITLPAGVTEYRILLNFKSADNSSCVTGGTKFIFDDFKISSFNCNGNCPPVANDDYFNSDVQELFKSTNTFKGNVYGGYALWASDAATAGYAISSLTYSPAINGGVDYDLNNTSLSGVTFALVPNSLKVESGPACVGTPSPGTLAFNPNGTFTYTKTAQCVTRVSFSYNLTNNFGTTLATKVIIDMPGQQIILPVSFKSFSAIRNKNNVAIRWETAMEQDNKGFYVQRNVNGEWKNIAFVFSAATNGNSSEVLSYAYNDANNFKTVSQYRILQVDIDGKGKYTEIRSVRAEEQVAKVMVFPNPSSDKVNVLFEDGNSAKDVVVTDISGRVVKQYRSITSNNLVIENLTDGFYTIQITDQQTAVSTVEKVVVKKR